MNLSNFCGLKSTLFSSNVENVVKIFCFCINLFSYLCILSLAPLQNQSKPDGSVTGSPPKAETPTNQSTLSVNISQSKSLSDSEIETTKKACNNASPAAVSVAEKKDKNIQEVVALEFSSFCCS